MRRAATLGRAAWVEETLTTEPNLVDRLVTVPEHHDLAAREALVHPGGPALGQSTVVDHAH